MIPQPPVGVRVYDLGRELSPDIPHHPNHPPFMYSLTKLHGDSVDAFGSSASSDIITMGTHVGTHIDGLAHFAVDGMLHGGQKALDYSTKTGGYSTLGIETLAPIVTHAVVADVPRYLGIDRLPDDHLITVEELQATLEHQRSPIPEGGGLLLRTGWGREWPNVKHPHDAPGPGIDTIRWAWDAGGRIFGSDTIPFERHPVDRSPVHRELLIERGAHIFEALDLEPVCAAGAWEFLLVAAPLKIRGATGAPVRPVALVLP